MCALLVDAAQWSILGEARMTLFATALDNESCRAPRRNLVGKVSGELGVEALA
jgi:hypothetical protein